MKEALKIDCYTHYASPKLLEYLASESPTGEAPFEKLFSQIPFLTLKTPSDIKNRLAFMKQHNIECQVLVPLPWIEAMPSVDMDEYKSVKSCMIANTQMSEVMKESNYKFLGVALIPQNSTKAALQKVYSHAIYELGLIGSVLFFGPQSHKKPDDASHFDWFYHQSTLNQTPIWIHPCRPQSIPDYHSNKEVGSSYAIWNSLGWVYDTSVVMVHLVMMGVFQQYPSIKIVCHHGGGMIPFFYSRFATQMANFNISEKQIKDLKKFYCDTAFFGYEPLHVIQCMQFFDKGRLLFGTDTPMDMSNPGSFTESSEQVIEFLRKYLEGEKNSNDSVNVVKGVLYGNVIEMLGHHANPIRKRLGLKPLPCPYKIASKL